MHFGLRRFLKLACVTALIFVLGACTTQKRRGDLSMMGKLWHNTTAHYNGYFNADELMTYSFLTLDEQHQDNYNQLLPMYEYIATDNHQAVASDLDEAIKKVSVVVNLHRESNWTDDCYLLVGKAQFLKKDYESAEETLRYMMEEFSPAKMAKLEKKLEKASGKGKKGKSATDSKKVGKDKDGEKEVLSGRAAEKARKKYNKELKKKRKQDKKRSSRKKGKKKKSTPTRAKKEEEATEPVTAETEQPAEETNTTPEAETEPAAPTTIRLSDSSEPMVDPDPPNYFMKHRPAYQEGVLWLAKTLIERDNYDNAQRLLNQLERDPNTFNDIRDQLAGVQAYYFIKRKDYPQAITYLDQAIESSLDRNVRARFAYIKAQLHQRMGQGEAAYNTFDQVLKLSNVYEMEFSARLNMAQNQWRSGQGSGEEARRNLEKMLKDPKNAEYADQIYYALGEIALESGNRAEAISYFQKSLNSGSRNSNQRAEAYYRLGRLFFEEETYIDAKYYFDSTLQVMPATDDRYQEVKKFVNNLTDIAANLETIMLQDSMLRISQMSEADRLALASEIKKKQDEEKLKAQLAAQQATASNSKGRLGARTATVANRGALKKESSFFAYNDRALKSGKRAFERKWGDRPLEDDWRRSNRSSSFGTDEEVVLEENTVPTIDPNNVSEYLGDYPKTEAEVEKAHSQIREAMYKLGSLYRERLDNHPQTIEVLERLNERYPGSNYELDSWYVLYLSYKDMNNQAKADEYFKKIIEKFPNSNYAKLLRDPNYASEFLDEERKLNMAYDQVYRRFTNGQYQDAYDQSQEALKKLVGQHPLKPKYSLLMAMCAGKLQGKDAYVKDLQRVVAMYPDSDEQKRAREILRALGVAGARLPGEAEEESSAFVYNESELHYIMIVFPEGQESVNQLRNEISDYNEKYHKLDKIRPASIYVGTDNKTPVIVLRRWKDKNDAMRYFEGVQKNKGEFIKDGSVKYEVLPISQNNYRQIIRARSVDGYKSFFDSNY
jgi:tetratricopeptide (TPR) repeat protein